MSFKDNYRSPKGTMGRILLASMNVFHTPLSVWTLEQISFPPDSVILDAGCGGGSNIRRMLKLCPEGKVCGLDISPESAAMSKRLNRKDLGSRCSILTGSADRIPSKDDFFSVVTAFDTVYFWNDIPKSFNEIRRVLRPDGRFVVSCDSFAAGVRLKDSIPGMTVLSPEKIKDLMISAGFSDVMIRKKDPFFLVTGRVHKK